MRRAALLLLALCLGAAPLQAKTDKPAAPPQRSAGLNMTDSKSGVPLEVYADDGLELSQDARKVTAHGNAKAIRGDVTLNADTLIAYYRERSAAPTAKPTPAKGKDKDQPAAGGGSEIWRIEAVGHVTIASPTQTVYGDHADYNIDDAVVVMTGQNLRLVTPTDTITARDSLEYWEQKQQAVARGNAVAIRGEKRIQADNLLADFSKNEQGQMAIQKAHAENNVVLTTPKEVVTGDHGDYDVESGIVILTGSVKITRDQNQLNGAYATVNLNTGISNLYPNAPGSAAGSQRVKGVFVPQRKDGGDGSSSSVKGR